MRLATTVAIVGVLVFAAIEARSVAADLDPGLLSQLRGKNQFLVVGTIYCDSVSGIAACTAAGDPCVTCATAWYKDLGTNQGQNGYNQNPPGGVAQDCGNQIAGICAAAGAGFQCVYGVGMNTGVKCKNPLPTVPTRQP